MMWTGDIKSFRITQNGGEFLELLSDCQLLKELVSCLAHCVTGVRFVFAELYSLSAVGTIEPHYSPFNAKDIDAGHAWFGHHVFHHYLFKN